MYYDSQRLKWKDFKNMLQQQPDLRLQFQYEINKFVDASYHITEIKQAVITSVDCGGMLNEWTEVILQLWEPDEKQQQVAMQVDKALAIISLVESTLPLTERAITKIEYGNAYFPTRQMYPVDVTISGPNLVVNLYAGETQCKAINRGGSCNTSDTGEECCEPVKKAKNNMVNLATGINCTPGGGCC